MLILAFAAASVWTASPIEHHVTVKRPGVPVQLTYRGHVETRMKTIGMAAGPRPGTERCRWRAALEVDRHAPDHGAALSRRLAGRHEIEGSHPGSCATARPAVERALAAKADDLHARVRAVAEADRATVFAELDGMPALASN